ncbi:hypothetical protein UlMin_032936 [Ulmus minor]
MDRQNEPSRHWKICYELVLWNSRVGGKSYADRRRRPLEFKEGDYIFLKVAPMKGVMRFGKKGKLSPRYIGPFEILERIGKVAYKLALPSELASVHNVFHVSMLRKYVSDPSHVLKSEPIEVREDLTYQEQPVQILDRKDKALRNKVIPLVKVLWRNHKVEEATWEREDEMRAKYPHLVIKRWTFRDKGMFGRPEEEMIGRPNIDRKIK